VDRLERQLWATTLTSPRPPRRHLIASVLEPGRTLTLAERGGGGAEVVVGAPGFLVLATMNPGGDFGKKELSPALSNRFTQARARARR
jgi:midasin